MKEADHVAELVNDLAKLERIDQVAQESLQTPAASKTRTNTTHPELRKTDETIMSFECSKVVSGYPMFEKQLESYEKTNS